MKITLIPKQNSRIIISTAIPGHKPTQLSITFTLTPYTFMVLNYALDAVSTFSICTKVHLSHPIMMITMKHLRILWYSMHLEGHHNLDNMVIYRHLRISAQSPLIPRDSELYITIDNTVCLVTTRRSDTTATTYRIKLHLSPLNGFPCLWHIYKVDERTTYCLMITTSLPSTISRSTRPQHHIMMCTTTYIPYL